MKAAAFRENWLVVVGAALALGLLSAAPARAQQVLVQADVAADTLAPLTGPNRRYFGHLYLGYALVAGPDAAGASVRYGPTSGALQVGGRLKLRLNQALALTADARYAYLRYGLAQQPGKVVPTTVPHEAEVLSLHQFQPELGLRLNVGERGNTVGNYLDLLAWGSFAFRTEYSVDDVPPPGSGSLQTLVGNPDYLRRTGGGLGVRLGHDRYALTARYRLSPAWAANYAAWPELPRWLVGVELGLF